MQKCSIITVKLLGVILQESCGWPAAFLVDFKYHDLQLLVPALRRARSMGGTPAGRSLLNFKVPRCVGHQ